MSWYLQVLKKYAVTQGRARRKEFWFFSLCSFLIMTGLGVLELPLGLRHPHSEFGILSGLYFLAILVPSFCVLVRRLHDIGRSGFTVLVLLLPMVGAVVILVFTLLDSDAGTNDYGPNPKEAMAEPGGGAIAPA